MRDINAAKAQCRMMAASPEARHLPGFSASNEFEKINNYSIRDSSL
jgi:hypothetical protein